MRDVSCESKGALYFEGGSLSSLIERADTFIMHSMAICLTGDLAMSGAQCHAIALLSEAGTMTLAELNSRHWADASTISRCVDKFQRCHLIIKAHGRSTQISMTAEGRAVARAYKRVAQRVEQRCLSSLSSDETTHLKSFLSRMMEAGARQRR